MNLSVVKRSGICPRMQQQRGWITMAAQTVSLSRAVDREVDEVWATVTGLVVRGTWHKDNATAPTRASARPLEDRQPRAVARLL
jgi:hypothetical protein